MMPPIPAVVLLPTETAHGYWPANVVAAIPLGHGSTYAVTAIEPTSSPDAPRFLVGEAGRSIHGFWVADMDTFPVPTLADALACMADLSGLRPVPRTEPAPHGPVPARTDETEGTCNCGEQPVAGDKPGDDCRNCGYTLTPAQWDHLPR